MAPEGCECGGGYERSETAKVKHISIIAEP
jgi:hypothetical protein